MSDEELSELLTHPRVRAWIRREAKEEAAILYAEMAAGQKQHLAPKTKPAASGDLNYHDAATFIGCPVNSVRAYASRGMLDRGALPFTITAESCLRFKRSYKPRPNGRISG